MLAGHAPGHAPRHAIHWVIDNPHNTHIMIKRIFKAKTRSNKQIVAYINRRMKGTLCKDYIHQPTRLLHSLEEYL